MCKNVVCFTKLKQTVFFGTRCFIQHVFIRFQRPFDISLDDGIMKGDDLASTPAPEVKSDTVDKQVNNLFSLSL